MIAPKAAASLQPLLTNFAEYARRRGWQTDTPETAFDRCHSMCAAFMWFAIARGTRGCSIVTKKELNKSVAFEPDGFFQQHRLVIVRSYIYVDWTARQFWPDVPYPLIADSHELLEYWKD